MDPSTVICRCEGITLSDVLEIRSDFAPAGLRELKLVTRLTMGMCQGRVCRVVVEALSEALGLPREAESLPLRPPFRPTPLGQLAEEKSEASP